jgi:hypothetical protein
MTGIKYMGIREFVEFGGLHEINRLLLHPLGLAMQMSVGDEDAGEETTVKIWDDRDDPEGILFADDTLNAEKAKRVCDELLARREERKKHTGGWVIQPIEGEQVLSTTYTDPELAAQFRSEAAAPFEGEALPVPVFDETEEPHA